MSDDIVLYDLKNKHNKCWSLNPWKTRLVLNLKGLRYRTEWIEYPDLEPTFKAKGIPPNPEGAFAAYSSPTIQLPDKSYVMDSQLITEKLESLYPEPSLHLNVSPYQRAAESCTKILFAVVGNFMAPVVDDWLDEPSKSWFEKDRSKRFGMTVWELRDRMGGEQVYAKAEPGLKELKALLQSHKKDEGPFVLGSQVSYADLAVIGLFESLERVEKGTYDRIIAYDESFKRLHQAGKKWTQRDGH